MISIKVYVNYLHFLERHVRLHQASLAWSDKPACVLPDGELLLMSSFKLLGVIILQVESVLKI